MNTHKRKRESILSSEVPKIIPKSSIDNGLYGSISSSPRPNSFDSQDSNDILKKILLDMEWDNIQWKKIFNRLSYLNECSEKFQHSKFSQKAVNIVSDQMKLTQKNIERLSLLISSGRVYDSKSVFHASNMEDSDTEDICDSKQNENKRRRCNNFTDSTYSNDFAVVSMSKKNPFIPPKLTYSSKYDEYFQDKQMQT